MVVPSRSPTSSAMRHHRPRILGRCIRRGICVPPNAETIRRIVDPRRVMNWEEVFARLRPPPAPRRRPPVIPDWGLGPAASSWARVPLRPRDQPQSNKARNHDSQDATVTSLICWDLAHDVGYDQLRSLCQVAASEVVGIFYNCFRHLVIVDFATERAAEKVLHWLSGRKLMDRPIKRSFFQNDDYILNRDTSSLWEKPGKLHCTVCVEGFDTSLHIEEIRTMLARHFRSNVNGLITPTNLDGSSIGKSYIKCESWYHCSEALNLDGSVLGGHKLRVTECCVGNKFWLGRITPDGPSTGKRIVFDNDRDDE